jgi:hypothetical protein
MIETAASWEEFQGAHSIGSELGAYCYRVRKIKESRGFVAMATVNLVHTIRIISPAD